MLPPATCPSAGVRVFCRARNRRGGFQATDRHAQRAEWIARLEARHARQEHDARPAATSEDRAARGRAILATM